MSMWALAAAIVIAMIVVWCVTVPPAHVAERQQCVFDRNELGPMGTHGQWWWDIYKCSDGTERRVLVAGPRG